MKIGYARPDSGACSSNACIKYTIDGITIRIKANCPFRRL